MNVQCVQCAQGFILDDAQVPPQGAQVKCSSCQHVFTVLPPAQKEEGIWQVRTTAGDIFDFRELTTLQRWIVERKVSREDAISKTGKHWKRLGDIADLAAFFHIVDQATTALTPSPAPEPAPAPIPAPASPSPAVAPAQAAWPTPMQPAATPINITVETPQKSSGLATDSFGDNSDFYEDDFDMHQQSNRGKWVAFILFALAVTGGGGYVALEHPELLKSYFGNGVSELAKSHITSGYTALHRDSYGSIKKALGHFKKAIALAPKHAPAHAALARSYLALAEWKALESEDLSTQLEAAQDDAKDSFTERITQLRQKSETLLEQAFIACKEAMQLAPKGLAPSRSMADYYRFKNAPAQMQPLLNHAHTLAPQDPYIAYINGSRMAGQPATYERAQRYFDAALEANPNMQRARFKSARLYFLAGDKDKARLHLDALIRDVPDHERAIALKDRIDPIAVTAPEPAPKEPPKPVAKTFDQLLQLAQRVRDRDQSERALSLYEQALELEPDDPDAMTGMGWCYFDMDQVDAAISTFEQVLLRLPRFTDAHLGIAEAYKEKGDHPKAIMHYKKYLDILPDGPDAFVAKNAIKQLHSP